MKIPKSFQCMAFKITVKLGGTKDKNHGEWDPKTNTILINPKSTPELQHQTFWHEVMHCIFTNLGYEKLSSNEQLVDQVGQCLAQLELTRK